MTDVDSMAKTVCKAMALRAVPPTPDNYTVWYNYIANTLPPLSAALETMVAQQVTFTDEINASLYQRYFGTPDEHDDVLEPIQEVGIQVQ